MKHLNDLTLHSQMMIQLNLNFIVTQCFSCISSPAASTQGLTDYRHLVLVNIFNTHKFRNEA